MSKLKPKSNAGLVISQKDKSNNYFVVALAIGILILTNIGTALLAKNSRSADELRKFSEKYPLLNPIKTIVPREDLIVNVQELREYLKLVPEKNKDWADISIYFEIMNSGANINVNQDLQLWPASLAKLPVAIATIQKVERKQIDFTTTYVIQKEDVDAQRTPELLDEVGLSYDVKFLLERLILESDNTAYKMLKRNLTDEDMLGVANAVGLDSLYDPAGKISSKDYARLLRVLHLGAYLNDDNSQYLLNLMTQSEYKGLLMAGLPGEVKFAHKWGTNIYTNIYADAGIVYVASKPYMISVMIRGKLSDSMENQKRAENLAKEIGEFTYNFVVNSKNQND